MLLIDLELFHFRPFLKQMKINFSRNPQRNVTLIHGLNGAGKTSLLTAINRVIYAEEAIIEELNNGKPIVNKEVIKAGSKDNPGRCVVHLRFSHDGKTYRLTRSATAYYEGLSLVQSDAKVDLWVTLQNGNTEKILNADVEMRSILPFAIRSFFVFDGEKVGEFTAPGREQNAIITRAVNDVLRIKPLENGVLHLLKLKTDYLKKLQAVPNPRTAELNNQISLNASEQKRLEQHKNDADEELIQKKKRIEIIDLKLSSFVEIKAQAEERRRVELDLREARTEAVSFRKLLSGKLLKHIAFPVRQQLSEAVVILGSYKSDHKIPARIQDYFIRELLEDGSCICGRSIAEDSTEQHRLEEILGSLLPGSLQDQASDLLSFLKPMSKELDSSEKEIVSSLALIEKNAIAIDRLETAIDRLGGEIDMQAAAEAKAVIAERKRLEDEVKAAETLQRSRQMRIGNIEREQNANQKALEVAIASQGKVKQLSFASGTFRELYDELLTVQNELELVIRKELSDSTTGILRSLAGREFFDRVEVEPGYLLKVYDNVDDDIRALLSNGQTQITALAFMMALTRLGGQEAPLVIDTPFGRLDKGVRLKLVTQIPKLKGQVVFFVTDSEYDGDLVTSALQPISGEEYTVKFITNTESVIEAVLCG